MNLIQTWGRSAKYLDFCTALCSCLGQPIISNQKLLLRLLVELDEEQVDKGLLIATRVGKEMQLRSWQSLSPAIITRGTAAEGEPAYLGERLYKAGYHPLMVGWCNLAPAGTPGNSSSDLFGSKWVQLSTLMACLNESNCEGMQLSKDEHRRSSGEEKGEFGEEISRLRRLKRDIAKFYRAQILLFAELCMGRNYVCITALEKLFPYSVVLTGMKDDTLPASLRAAFTSLMLCLHVDRFPQVMTHDPDAQFSYYPKLN